MSGRGSHALTPYVAVVRARFGVLLQYRAAAIAGFVTQCWWGGIKVMVLTAFFAASAGAPMTLPQAIDYVWLGQALFTMLPWSGDPDVARMVRTGDVAYERLRPLDTYAFWYSRAVARRTANPALRALPMLLTAGVLLRVVGWSAYALRAPAGVAAALLFVASIALVIALSAAVSALIDALTVATLSDRGVTVLVSPLVIVLSGSLVPLPLFPDWLQPILRNQPFAGLMDTPFRIYTGNLAGGGAVFALARQAIWVVVLVLLGRVVMARVMSRLQTQGG
jgi:ABC-2 type transport system permease protein